MDKKKALPEGRAFYYLKQATVKPATKMPDISQPV